MGGDVVVVVEVAVALQLQLLLRDGWLVVDVEVWCCCWVCEDGVCVSLVEVSCGVFESCDDVCGRECDGCVAVAEEGE